MRRKVDLTASYLSTLVLDQKGLVTLLKHIRNTHEIAC